MKIVITESQYKRIMEDDNEILHISSLNYFNNDWFKLQEFLEKKGNPPYSFGGDLSLTNTMVHSLGSLVSVEGNLDLRGTPLTSFGSLQRVDGYLDLEKSKILKKYSEEEIRKMIDIKGVLYR